ncbi:MAG: DNA gyrase subunit B [Synergistales bacterium]|nr:DNA gyrase subunit B [Synergistales bacterium]
MNAAARQYSAKDIQILEGLTAVRKRPSMYIGDTGTRGLHHLVYEVVDNSLDEALAGHCDQVTVTVHGDNSVSIEDNGRGIPVDIHPHRGKAAAEVVLTVLHAGGKFDNKSYQVSGGLHGVGVSVVNALSSWLRLTIHREGHIWYQEYKEGFPQDDLAKQEETGTNGTTIHFLPDPTIFSESEFSWDLLSSRLRELAFLNPGILIRLRDKREDKAADFQYEGGIKSFVEYLNRGKDTLFKKPVHVTGEREGTVVDIALQYNDSFLERIFAFANLIHTVEGGTHVSGFRTALTRAINEGARREKFLKEKDANLTGEDLREGLTTVISVKLQEPQFEGQTKTKLGNGEMKGIVDSILYDGLISHFDDHPEVLKVVVEKALRARQAREAAKKARDLVRRKSAMSGLDLPGKLADCSSKKPEESEIYIVEGDSAGGSAKQGRDRNFQAILPLRGKILNVEKSRLDKALGSKEIRAIIQALGCGIGDDFDHSKLRYHRLIIMSVDGAEQTFVRTPEGNTKSVQVGTFIDGLLERRANPSRYEILCFDPNTGTVRFKTIKNVIAHSHNEPLYRIHAAYGRSVTVTGEHSVFVRDEEGKAVLKRGDEIAAGDVLACPATFPEPQERPERLDLIAALLHSDLPLDEEIVLRGESVREYQKAMVRAEHADTPQLVEERVAIPTVVGTRLREHRKALPLTGKELCEAVGIQQPVTFYAWENGTSRPTVSHFESYCRTLDFDPSGCEEKVTYVKSALERGWEEYDRGSHRNRIRPSIGLKDLDVEHLEQMGDDLTLTPRHYADEAIPRHIPVNAELMELLGFFVAEGAISMRNGIRLAIGKRNEPYVGRISEAIRNVFGIDPTYYPGTFQRASELRILNRVVFAVFRHVFGFDGVKSWTKRVPDLVFNVGGDLRTRFLKGYFMGDGTLSRNMASFTTTSRTLAEQLLYLLLGQGIIAGMHSKEPTGASSGLIRGKEVYTKHTAYTVTISGREAMRSALPIWEDHAKAGTTLEWMRTCGGNGSPGAALPMEGDLIGFPVRSVEQRNGGGERVYDFSVEGDETFICGTGGVCCHNTDADVDGAHIRTLLLTLFYRYMPELIEHGNLYVAQPPLYRLQAGKRIEYCFTEKERREISKSMNGKKINLQRYKGLGEMNPDQLWETTMDPATRVVKQVEVEDAVAADEFFSILMGDKVEPRREFIESHAREVRNLDV